MSNFILYLYAYRQYRKLYNSNFRQLICFLNDDTRCCINHLNAKLNPICNFLTLLGAHPILHVSRISVDTILPPEDEQDIARNMYRIVINVLKYVHQVCH
jgi:hypothetical protein